MKMLLRLSLLAVVVPLSGAQCGQRACETAANCERACNCTNGQTGDTFACNAFFTCDSERKVCGDDYNASCDEICSRFAARDQCGNQGCQENRDCIRSAPCALVDEQSGQPLCEFTCNLTFECNSESRTCDPEFAADDTTICAACNPCDSPACAPFCQ